MNPVETIGAILGTIGVVLMIRRHLLAWPVGMVQVAVYGWVFFRAKLYSDVILQGVFFVLLAYGWWRWRRGDKAGAARVELPVSRLSGKARVGFALAGVGLTFLWGEFMHRTTEASLPYWDASILAFSLLSQWLQARKKIENWIGWIVVNVIAIGVYAAKDLTITAMLYTVFLALAFVGFRAWRLAERERIA